MKFFEKMIPVLMYHHLNQPDPSSSLTVSPENFSCQIDWLERKKFNFLSLDEIVDRQGRSLLWERVVALTFDDGFRDNYENAFPLLSRRSKRAALFVVVNWVGQNGFVNWREIRELSDSGVTIGSHGLSHRWLPAIADEKELQQEIFDSRKKIEDAIGKEVRHFCYPVGGADERVVDEVKKAGYKAAWVAGARPSVPIQDRLFSLRRIKVTPSDSNPLYFSIKAYGITGLFG